MLDKVLVVIVTRNNDAFLQHLTDSFKSFDAGYPYDVLILDNSSNNTNQLRALDSLSKKYRVETIENNRVEVSYDVAWKKNKDYKYYFFIHDDSHVNKDNWLKVFVDRMNSGHSEKIIESTHLNSLPIGKVCLGTQPWRSYSSILGYPVQCIFLEHILDVLRPGKAPKIFRFGDCDRIFIKNECLQDTNGIRNIAEFSDIKNNNPELYGQLCNILNRYLPYPDDGSYPASLYGKGQCWSKFALTAEFLNSIDPLISGWRTVGLLDDGYLEQIHGFDIPAQQEYVSHYGSPNFREFVAKVLNTDREEVRKYFNNKVFLLKLDKILKDYWKATKNI